MVGEVVERAVEMNYFENVGSGGVVDGSVGVRGGNRTHRAGKPKRTVCCGRDVVDIEGVAAKPRETENILIPRGQ